MILTITITTITIFFAPYLPIFIKDKRIEKQLTDKEKLLNKLHK